jgi:hypothetical protein
MKFQVEVPDQVFWMVSRRAEAADMTAPQFVAVVASRLAALEQPAGDPLAVLQRELRAARDAGWRAPRRSRAVKKKPRVDFTSREMEIALAAMNGKQRNG